MKHDPSTAIASAHDAARHHWQRYRHHEERADDMASQHKSRSANPSPDAIESERLKAETHLAICTCYRSIVGMLRELER